MRSLYFETGLETLDNRKKMYKLKTMFKIDRNPLPKLCNGHVSKQSVNASNYYILLCLYPTVFVSIINTVTVTLTVFLYETECNIHHYHVQDVYTRTLKYM